MLKFDAGLEKFKDFVNFTKDDPCIWVVYPAGAAGDLLATIINYHYANTSASFKGMDEKGRMIFRPTDAKLVNFVLGDNDNQLLLDEKFFLDLIGILSEKSTNYSLLDQFIFSNHAFDDAHVSTILNTFPKCKIIRILPKTIDEFKIICWLANYKNLDTKINLADVDPGNRQIQTTTITDARLLDINFSDIINPVGFEQIYEKIINHLSLSGKLIRFDFVQQWLDGQDDYIRPYLNDCSKI